MSRPVALSRIQDLGVRGRNDPPVQPSVWAGMNVDGGALRALHEALHPTLLLLAFAGYQVDDVVVGPPRADDVVLVDLSPRNGGPFPWEAYLGAAAAFPSAAAFAVAVPLDPRAGLTGQVVEVAAGALAPLVRTAGARRFLVFDITAAANLRDVTNTVALAQTAVRDQLAALISQAWAANAAGEVTTGLLSALLPDLWTFPLLLDPADLQRQTFRQLGDAVTADGFASAQALEGFLLDEALVRAGGVPPSVHDRLAASVPAAAGDLVRNWNTEAEALWNLAYPNAITRPPFRRADHRRLSFSELVFDMLNEGLVSLAGYDPAADEAAYGGFDLQRGDRDPAPNENQWIYGGNTLVRADPALPLPDFIAKLRADLATVGFGPLADGDPAPRRVFGAFLESAVREFQIYASMGRVARFATPADGLPVVANPGLVGTLIGQANDQRYTGPISGALNAETRALLKMWVERDWHCPVVVEARTFTNAQLLTLRDPAAVVDKRALAFGRAVAAGNRNLWRRDQAVGNRTTLTFVAWDFTGHYQQPPGRAADHPIVVSTWSNNWWGGASAIPPSHNWPEAEIKPDTIFGAFPDPALRHDQEAFWSTFRIFRSIAEPESVGTLDGMNAWDSAIVSGGPWHWTLGLGKNVLGDSERNPVPLAIYPGELGPLLAMAAARLPAHYDTFFGTFGIQPQTPWAEPPVAHFSSGQRKFRGWILLQDADGNWVDARQDNPATVPAGNDPVPNQHDFELIEVLHHWHWIYRWQMFARLGTAIRPLMWDLARARLRALLTADWGGAGGAVAGLTVGDVFTSEQAVAMLERLHVFWPWWLLDVGDIDAEWRGANALNIDFNVRLGPAFQAAAGVPRDAPAGNDPVNWGDVQEAALIDWLRRRTPAAGMNEVADWPVAGTYQARGHDPAWLPLIAEEAPDIGGMPPMRAAPGEVTIGRFTVTDRETPPARLVVTATSADPVRLPASVRHHQDDEFELVLQPPAGAAEGEVLITLRADDHRQVTTRELFVNVTAGNAPPVGVPAAYARPAPINLCARRGSFRFDGAGLFAAP